MHLLDMVLWNQMTIYIWELVSIDPFTSLFSQTYPAFFSTRMSLDSVRRLNCSPIVKYVCKIFRLVVKVSAEKNSSSADLTVVILLLSNVTKISNWYIPCYRFCSSHQQQSQLQCVWKDISDIWTKYKKKKRDPTEVCFSLLWSNLLLLVLHFGSCQHWNKELHVPLHLMKQYSTRISLQCYLLISRFG